VLDGVHAFKGRVPVFKGGVRESGVSL